LAINRKKTKNGEIHYIVRVRDSIGRWFPSKTFEQKTDAKRHERTLLSQRDIGVSVSSIQQRNIPFEEYKAKWTIECRSKMSEGWKKKQDQMIKDYIVPCLEKRKLSEIKSCDIEAVLVSVKKQGLGEQVQLHIYNILHKMFDDAINMYEILPKNPVVKRLRPKITQKERTFLEPSESQALLNQSKSHSLGVLIWIQIYSGLRPGETTVLRVKDLDFERNQILIRTSYNRSERCIQDHTKQGDWGMAPMPPALKNYLIESTKDKNEDSFIVEKPSGGMVTYESYNLTLKKLCHEAGVKIITPHELRHSSTELYYEAGASAEDIRRLLNHKSISCTQKYIHRTDRRLSSIAEKVGCTNFEKSEG